MDLALYITALFAARKRSASAEARQRAWQDLDARSQGAMGRAPAPTIPALLSKAARCRCSAACPSAASAMRPGTGRFTSSMSAISNASRTATVDAAALKEAGLAKGPATGRTHPGHGRIDQETDREGAPLFEVGGREDPGQGGHGGGDSAAQEAEAQQDEAAQGERQQARRRARPN